MELIKKILHQKYFRYIFPLLAGGTLGFLYYSFIGCNGSCAIAGNPWISTAYGVVAGALFIKKEKKETSIG